MQRKTIIFLEESATGTLLEEVADRLKEEGYVSEISSATDENISMVEAEQYSTSFTDVEALYFGDDEEKRIRAQTSGWVTLTMEAVDSINMQLSGSEELLSGVKTRGFLRWADKQRINLNEIFRNKQKN